LILRPVSQRWRGEVLKLNYELLEEARKIFTSERVAWVGFNTGCCRQDPTRKFPNQGFRRQD